MSHPLLRRAAVVGALLVVLALLASLVLSIYGGRRLERARQRLGAEVGLADLSRFELPAVPDPENAAAWLAAGAGAIVLSQEEKSYLRSRAWATRKAMDTRWTEEDVARIERLIAANAPAMELLERSIDCRRSSYGVEYAEGPDAELPPMIDLLMAARLVWMDGRLALASGDWPRLARDLRILDRLAGSLANESLLVAAIVAVGVDRYLLDLVHRVVTSGGGPASLLEEIETMVAGIERSDSFRRAFAAEASMAASVELGLLLTGDRDAGISRLAALVARPAHRLLLAEILDSYADLTERLDEPFASIPIVFEAEAGILPTTSLAAIIYPNLIDAIGKLQTGETLRLLARRAVQLSLARLEGAASPGRPGPIGAEPYSGRQMTLEVRPDGTVVLAAGRARELWRERNPTEPFPGEPPFVWEVPPSR